MRFFTVLAVAVLLGGCVTTNSTQLGVAKTSLPVAPTSVIVYRTADQVGRPYSEVALLNSSGDSLWTTEEKMIVSMREEAAKLGADGIILEGIQEPNAAIKVAAAFLHLSAPRKGQALAIRTVPE